ncbi:unnamed protein product [Polarella glacialis]|uniref:Uncharacterized protein n=1 Tax=Polarella glacialis TaxID=89957 RepID=A0A813K4M9_POLGL|nr:unnamed protein product [Polarella glacialis]
MLARERESRDKLHETHLEHLQRESSSREGQNKDIHDILVKERSMREQHHATYQEFLHSERSARMQMEELLAQERHERGRHHETVGERVDSLQRTVSIFDSLIRKEMEERAKEHRRIWDAIDNHTHDLSTQVLDVANKNDDEEGSRPEMRTVLPPSRVIRPSSAGSPVTYSWSMPQTHPDPATIVGSVTRQFPGEPMTTGSMARVQSPLRELRTLPGPVTMGVAFWDSQAPARIGQAPSAYGHSLSRCGTNGSVSPQYSSGNSPMPGQKGADRPNASVERVMCGHSHYGGERSHKAEVHTGFVHHLG